MTREQNETLERLAEKIATADAIVIGGGSGLSSASGYDHYRWSPALTVPLERFREFYGFTSPFVGFYHCYFSYGEQWGYYSQYIRAMLEAPTGQPYQDHLWDSRELVEALTPRLDGIRLPEDRVPRCLQCGRILVPWVRDDTFLKGSIWQKSLARYQNFLRHWLLEQTGKRVLLLELGVGEMTPSIIKLPFWEMTAKNEGVFYACLNRDVSHTPAHLAGRSLYLAGDLAETLAALRQQVKGES